MDIIGFIINFIPRFLLFMFLIVIWLYILPNRWTNTHTVDDKFRLASILSLVFSSFYVLNL
jgi:hypothetical protein